MKSPPDMKSIFGVGSWASRRRFPMRATLRVGFRRVVLICAGAQLALVTDARHLSAACGSVDVVIAPYIRARYPCAAHLVDRRALKPFATTLVYIDPTASGLRVFTRMPRANTARV